MKAACLIVCLALAHQSLGHIFRRQQQRMEDGQLIEQPRNYIDQQSQQQRFEKQQPRPYQYDDESQREYLKKVQRQQYQQYPKNQEQFERQQYLKNQEQYQDRYQTMQSVEYKPRKQAMNKPYQSQGISSESQQQYEPQLFKQHKTTQKKFKTHDSSSSESREQNQKYQDRYQTMQSMEYKSRKQAMNKPNQYQSSSSESQQQYETQQLKQHKTTQKKSKTLDSSSSESREKKIQYSVSSEEVSKPFLKRKDSMKPYGDAITWNGIKIALSHKTPVTKKDIEKIYADAYETMSHVSTEDKQIFRQQYEMAAQTENPDARLNATELLNKNNYPVEEHTIKTDDGYLLTLFRIVKDSSVPKPVVFLMHGLLGSADDWLLMGPSKSLAYLLADAGYDVWLGNARGNKYSQKHVTKHPALSDFWQFSTDEIALHDLPAMIDYVLDITKQQKLVYVGHSIGTTAFLALAASRPEFNDKISMMFALSPMAYMSNSRSPLLRMIAPTSKLQDTLQHQLGHGEFRPSKQLIDVVGGAMIEKEIGVKSVADNINFVMAGVNVENLDAKLIPVILGHLPAGGSTRQLKQLGQAVASDEFTKYDFGSVVNQRVYGSSMPPKYDMQKVQTPVVVYYSEEDWMASPSDVERLVKELPNASAYKVEDPHFGQMAFQFSEKAPASVYRQLIETIKNQPQTMTLAY